MEKSEYRNSVRSRRLICDALLELMNEKPLKKITITDIVKRADVNRGTFYLHYGSISDVINELQETLLSQMDQYFSDENISFNTDNIMLLTAGWLKYIYEQNQTKYVPLLFNYQLNFADKVSKSFQARLLAANDAPKDENSKSELIVRASLLVHGVIGVFNASANGLLNVSPEQLVHSIDHLVTDLKELQTRKTDRI